MKLIIGENALEWLERLTYRGGIGIYYESTLGGVATYIIAALLCIFTIIGIIATIKWLFKSKKKKDPYKEWMKTGKM